MARENPQVSVIISTYNRPDLLKRSIFSVMNQTFKDFELLVVDDYSADAKKNKETVEEFKDERVRYILLEGNHGSDSHPKNIGIKEAKGKYVTFLDDDDTYRPEALHILHTYAEETDADVTYGDYLIGADKRKPGWSLDFSAKFLAKRNFIAMCVVMCKRDMLLKVGGFDEDVPKFKDWNLWLRIQKAAGIFIHVPILVSDILDHEDTISARYKVKHDDQGNYLPILLNEDGTERELFNPADCKIFPEKTVLGPKPPLRVAIYTLTMNRLELTKIMAESLKTAGCAFDWFIIDQGSKDGTKEWLEEFRNTEDSPKKLLIQYNKENVGLAAGWNQAIEFIKKTGDYDICIKIDNDAEMLTQDWLKDMVDLFERNVTLILSPYVEGLEKSPGGVLRQRPDAENPYIMIGDRVLGNVPNLGGIVFACRMELFKEWKFDAKYEGNKDYLLSQYAKALGYVLCYMEEYRVGHQLGSSGQQEKYPEYFKDPTNDSIKQ